MREQVCDLDEGAVAVGVVAGLEGGAADAEAPVVAELLAVEDGEGQVEGDVEALGRAAPDEEDAQRLLCRVRESSLSLYRATSSPSSR